MNLPKVPNSVFEYVSKMASVINGNVESTPAVKLAIYNHLVGRYHDMWGGTTLHHDAALQALVEAGLSNGIIT